MAARKLPEYIQLDNLDFVQQELNKINYKIVHTVNNTNIAKELAKEKAGWMKTTAEVSKGIIPEIRNLNKLFKADAAQAGEALGPKVAKMPKPKKAKKKRGRPKKLETVVKAKRTPTKKAKKPKRAAPAPKKSSRVKAGKKSEDAALSELKKSLASIRADLEKI